MGIKYTSDTRGTETTHDDSSQSYVSPREAAIQSIQRLASHLAESVVEFVVDETERKQKHDTRSSFRERSSVLFVQNSQQEVSKLRQSRFLEEKPLSNIVWESNAQDDESSVTACSQQSGGSTPGAQIGDVWNRSTKQESAVLFVDISGFTKLSIELDIEMFSKVINDCMELIVNIIKSYGGDILRFAGDALLVEWQVSVKSSIRTKFSREETVLMASHCAAELVKKLSDFPVIVDEQEVSTLNLHCGIGFGQVVGAHVGNNDRMEYLILGDTIRQIQDALTITSHGDVAVSTQVLELLEKSIEFDTCKNPHIIASKSESWLKPIRAFRLPPTGNFMERILARCAEWSDSSLDVLQRSMSRYVHPVVLYNEDLPGNGKNKGVVENPCHLEAELRQVFTVFIQPETDVSLMRKSADNDEVLMMLNQLMTIVNTEVVRFGGHLRQFILDDKGLLLIANFGLRGSTFPNMIEDRAMPLMTNVKTLLKTELNLGCKLGATYGNAYCGVVGGRSRHEYAVLSPSVNLAARLMIHKDNPGILVNEAVKKKAGIHPFVALPSVKAKGHNNPVKIFKPEDTVRKTWKDIGHEFVGRQRELAMFSSFAENIISKQKSSTVALVSGPYGSGKSSLLVRSTKQIRNMCETRKVSCHTACHIFCDDDSFKPFSIARPIFLNLLSGRHQNWTTPSVEMIGHQEQRNLNEAQMYVSFLEICFQAKIPGKYIEVFGGLIFTDKLSDIGKWSDRSQKMSEWIDIACYLAKVLVHVFARYGLVLFALDDVSAMDEMSWKVIELLYLRSSNLLVIGTSRNPSDMNIDPDFWNGLKGGGRFTHLELSSMDKVGICKLVGRIMDVSDFEKIDKKVARCVHILSEGNPLIASEILKKLYKKDDNNQCSLTDLGSVGELLLNRLDSLSPKVRSLLSTGAILGVSFDFMDIVKIMERYNKIEDPLQKENHTELVWTCLNEAVEQGILDETNSSSNRVKYVFTHRFWRENILNFTLDKWKNEVLGLVANEKQFLHLCTNLEEQVNERSDEVSTHTDNVDQQLEKLRVSLNDTISRDNQMQQQLQLLLRKSMHLKQCMSTQ